MASAPACYIATGNPAKARQYRHFLEPHVSALWLPSDLLQLYGCTLPECEEDEEDFTPNAASKCAQLRDLLSEAGALGPYLVLADDSGFSLDALHGFPGPVSRRWLAQFASMEEGLSRLRFMLEEASDSSNAARMVCSVAVYDSRTNTQTTYDAFTTGTFVYPPRSQRTGMQYDGCFQPEGAVITMGEMSDSEKYRYSPRSRCLRRALDALQLGRA